MKTKIDLLFVFVLLMVLTINFSFLKDVNAQDPRNMFRIGAVDNGWMKNNYSQFQDLGVNTWHKYSGCLNTTNNGWHVIDVTGDLRETGNGYIGAVNQKIDDNYNSSSTNHLITELDRVKINYLGFGKRSDYQCEMSLLNNNYYLYGYNNYEQNYSVDFEMTIPSGPGTEFIKGRKFIAAIPPVIFPDGLLMISGLRANTEQWNNGIDVIDDWWYLMPRMKINTDVFIYHGDWPVCKIRIVKYSNNTYVGELPSIVIHAQDFLQSYGNYYGEFIQTYPTIQNTLKLLPSNFTSTEDNFYDRLDFEIYWYGYCDLWIDRIRVENEIAYNLLGDNPIPDRHNELMDWLNWEVNEIADNKIDPPPIFSTHRRA